MNILAMIHAKARNVAAFKRNFPHTRIVEVNGRTVLGSCENCGLPVFDSPNHVSDSDGVMWHKRCPRKARA